MKLRKPKLFRSAPAGLTASLALGCLAMLFPARLSADTASTIGFDTDGDTEGFVAYSTATATFPVTTAGGFLTGTSPGGDPRMVRSSSTPLFSKPSEATWISISFRVRETDETDTVVTPWSNAGLAIVINSANSGTAPNGAITLGSATTSAVDSGDGFFTVSADLSGFTGDEIRYLRFDPIGAADAAANRFEVDFIQVTRTDTAPSLVTTNPGFDAIGVAPDANLVATFDEPMFLNTTGSVTIKNLNTSVDTVISLPGPDADGSLSVSGNQLTIDPSVDLEVGDEYAVEISSDALKNANGLFYAGILYDDEVFWAFTTDDIAPQLAVDGLTPAPLFDNWSINGDLSLTFDENVVAGSGNVVVYDSNDLLVESIDVTSPSVSIDGATVTISLTSPLVKGSTYYVLVDSGAFADPWGNTYEGISDSAAWSFTTDSTPPALAANGLNPAPESDNVAINGLLFLAFEEDVLVGSGNLVVYDSDDIVVESIAVTSPNVSVNGSQVSISPTVSLVSGNTYYVLIDSGTFTDFSGNGYEGISDSTAWSFTTLTNDLKVLFADSFNRLGGNDLNASAIGKYGTLGALSYTTRQVGVGNAELSGGQLLIQSNENPGNSGALVYINHNFTDSVISSGGGFSITVDINAYSTNGSTRYMSVAVGQSTADLDSQTTASASTSAKGDLVVGYRDNNSTLSVIENGTASTTADLPAPPTKMRIDYSLSDFNAGSTVNYDVFFDDSETPFKSGTFTWSGTGENYISLSSNLIISTTPGVRHSLFDDLEIRSLIDGTPSGFVTWQSNNGATGGLEEDHDGDGVTNGVEYFLFGSANSTGFTALPGVTDTAGTLSTTWTKAASGYSGSYTIDFVIEFSETLAPESWTSAATSESAGVAGTVFIDGDNVTYTFPTGTKQFARLKVTGP